jgi:hypothetical protein
MEKKIANDITKEIKAKLAELKKKRPHNSVHSLPISIVSFGNTNNNICISFYNAFQGKRLVEGLTRYQVKTIAVELVKCLKELKATRGWSRLMWEMEDCCYDSKSWYDNSIKFPTNIVLMANPCKEYKSLANYLAKYCGRTLCDTDIYEVGIGGKRGRVYGEDGERMYLCHDERKCAKLLETLRKSRGTNDKVVCTPIKEKDEIDPFDLLVSRRNETEFEGMRYKYFEVHISTPSGKQKANITIG